MNMKTQAIRNEIEQLAQDANALVAATADVASAHVGDARKRLAAGVDRVREIYATARGKALDGSHAADAALHDNLYQTIGVGILAGALVGFIIASQCHSRRE